MHYNQRVLSPRSAPKPTFNPNTLLSLESSLEPSLKSSLVFVVVPLFRLLSFVVVFFFSLVVVRASTHIYRQRSHDDKSARVISKILCSGALELERFFYGTREPSRSTFNSVMCYRQSALRHHRLAKEKKKDAFEQLQVDNR